MLGTTFFHNTTREIVLSFGNMFNNIHIQREDSSGNVVQQVKVPIQYGPKEYYLAKINSSRDGVQQILPQLSFQITGFTKSGERQVNRHNEVYSVNADGTKRTYAFNGTPWDLTIDLTVYARSSNDGYQIIEQIIPFFNPDQNITIKSIPGLDLRTDVPVELTGVSPDENYQGGQDTEHRLSMWTLNFTSRAFYYGPIRDRKIITTAITNLYASNTSATYFNNVAAIPTESNTSSNILSNAAIRTYIFIKPLNATWEDEYWTNIATYDTTAANEE